MNWAYWEEESEQWVVLDKEALDNAKTVSLEKVIGFEGRPDPSSGTLAGNYSSCVFSTYV